MYSDIGMVYSGICIDLENRYRLDSVLYIDKCTLQYCIRNFLGYIRDSVLRIFTASVRTLVWCTQHIYSVLLYDISVHLNIYQGFSLVNDKTVYSVIF